MVRVATGQGGYGQGGYAPPQSPPPGGGYGQDGYGGGADVPPPAGYNPGGGAPDPQADQAYAASAEQWASTYCVKSGGNVAGGALLGGALGALTGSVLAGRHDRGTGAIAGAAGGAVLGGAVAAGQGGGTSPGCPPGYVLRGGAPAFYYGGAYAYAAPGDYQPWAFYGGRWTYRPYPYHGWYYRHHRPDRY